MEEDISGGGAADPWAEYRAIAEGLRQKAKADGHQGVDEEEKKDDDDGNVGAAAAAKDGKVDLLQGAINAAV